MRMTSFPLERERSHRHLQQKSLNTETNNLCCIRVTIKAQDKEAFCRNSANSRLDMPHTALALTAVSSVFLALLHILLYTPSTFNN